MKNYWDKAISFEEYLQIANERLENPATPHDAEYKMYYELGIQRMDRTLKKFVIDEEQINELTSKKFNGKKNATTQTENRKEIKGRINRKPEIIKN